jgi:adenylosuccinate synthase
LFFLHPTLDPSFVEGANLALLDLDYINTFDNLTSPSTSASNAAASTWIGVSASK